MFQGQQQQQQQQQPQTTPTPYAAYTAPTNPAQAGLPTTHPHAMQHMQQQQPPHPQHQHPQAVPPESKRHDQFEAATKKVKEVLLKASPQVATLLLPLPDLSNHCRDCGFRTRVRTLTASMRMFAWA
jgi:hypothetical protein